MKGKKTTTFALIISVACVWGIIFYKVFSATMEDEELGTTTLPKPVKYEPLDGYLSADTLKLSLSYADPFLKEVVSEPLPEDNKEVKKEIVLNPVRSFAVVAPPRPVINWGAIKYNGYIVNPERKTVVCILSVNGKEYMLSEGEGADGVKLLKSTKDSIKVLYQQNTRFIKIQL